MRRNIVTTALATVAIAAAAVSFAPASAEAKQCGKASWYGPGFHGRTTANGEKYNQNAMTAAHKGLRFGSKVRVTNQRNGKSVTLRINDRGPFIKGRIIDVSKAAAGQLGMRNAGVAPVCVSVIG